MKLSWAGVVLALAALLLGAACAGGSAGAPGQGSTGGADSVGVDAGHERQVTSARPGFSFAASGDLGANGHTRANLRLLNRSSARFFLALGDLDYDQTPTDRAWCRYVKDRLPAKSPRYPFQLLAGNHESDGGEDGRIWHFTRCLPDRLDSRVGPRSQYGVEYAFTYPRHRPMVKVIMVSPGLQVRGVDYRYEVGSAHRRWLIRQIRQARHHHIRWIVVGMHNPCLTTGIHRCDAGPAVMNVLVRRRVDLVLVAHNHVYERSKQLRTRSGCRWIPERGFRARCVVDRGGDGVYRKGRGTVFVTAGSFGGTKRNPGPRDPERRYFADVNDDSYGFPVFRVRPDSLRGRFISPSGHRQDLFRIVRR